MNAQHDRSTTNRPTTGRGYLNAVLTANAVLLGVIALGGLGITGGLASVSKAQSGVSEDAESRTSAAEQRKQIITELRSMTLRLDKIDQTLSKGVNVNVKNFPADFGKDSSGGDAETRADSKSAPDIKKVERPAPRVGTVQPK